MLRHRLLLATSLLVLLAASAESRTIKLAWDANTEPDIAGYVIVYGYASGSYTGSVDVGKQTAGAVDVSDTRAVYFAVRAYNTSGQQSPPSAEVVVPGAGALVAMGTPSSGAGMRQPFSVTGWSADPSVVDGTGVDMVHVYAYPNSLTSTPIFLGVATYGLARPDVATALGAAHFSPSGFSLQVTSLQPGAYVLVAYGHSAVTNTWSFATRNITVLAGPVLTLESPVNGSLVGQPFYVTGWAVDTRAVAGTGISAVRVYAQPAAGGAAQLLGTASFIYRADVAQRFGARFGTGAFVLLANGVPPGPYVLTVTAFSTVSNSWAISASSAVTTGPVTAIDTPDGTAQVGQGFTVSGWSIDRRSTSGSGISAVHLYAFPVTGGSPVFLGTVTPNQSRPDVASVYGSQFGSCGYTLGVTKTLAQGNYVLAAYPFSTISGKFASPTQVAIRVGP